ncbi:MAG: sigma-70 family RNA polymerase sigma factor [Bacteroidetes bacterium]|nr:sigma-70 family RNA polymerase sigma factor [Bacteroidota bacterium]MBK9543704.1 sigma-70 family RNA polymerase sigma factor [Bacteroidota bacterium]MBP6401960.1 sigma-70 family RNA polymerase sigma factor [Bacteroidia bacterium]
MAGTLSDNDLLKKIAKADSSAFSHLYKIHYAMVRYLVEKNSGSSEDAADIFQEVMVILYEKIRDHKLNLTCSLKTYIYSVARNQWLKKLKSKKQTVSFRNFEDFILLEEENSISLDLNLRIILQELGDACRKLLILFYYRKNSMEEISTELNYANADTAKTQKYKCLQRLKKMLTSKNYGTES